MSAVSYIVEPPDLWSGVPGGPTWVDSGPTPGWLIDDYTVVVPASTVQAVTAATGKTGPQTVRITELPPELLTASGRLAAQDAQGIAAEVLYPSPDLWGAMGMLLDADTEIACARAYNDWLSDFVKVAPDRFVGIAQIPSQGGLAVAVEELHRAQEAGLRGVQLRAFPTGGAIPTPDDDTFWSALQESKLVLTFDGSYGPSVGGDIMGGARGTAPAAPLMQIVYTGVLDRFPSLRIVIAGPSAGWIPHWLERSDDAFLRYPAGRNAQAKRALPSAYHRSIPFFTVSGADPLLDYPDDYVPSSHLLWSSHYPTYHALDAAATFDALGALDADSRDRMLGGTARGLYGLPGGAPVDLDPPVKPLPHAVPV